MNRDQVNQVVSFLAKVKPEGEMKAHVINSLNALMQSNDPMSNRFLQVFAEAMNRAAVTVLNESAGVPNVPAFVPFSQPTPTPTQNKPATPEMLSESILAHAEKLMM